MMKTTVWRDSVVKKNEINGFIGECSSQVAEGFNLKDMQYLQKD